MKWQIKYMVDPGDGIVTYVIKEYPTDDISQVVRDFLDNNTHGYWLFAVEALPE